MIHQSITTFIFILLFCSCTPALLSAQCTGPTGQNTTSSDNSVAVQWTGGSTDALRQEHVLSFCAIDDPATGSVVSLEAINPSINFSGLLPGTAYFVYVRNICDAGNGAEEASDWVTFTIMTTGSPLAPDIDDLANASTLSLSASSQENFAGEEVIATSLETNETVCGYDNSWWYAFTPTVTQLYTLSSGDLSATTLSTDTDVSLGVYTGNAHPLTEVVCQNTNNQLGGGETLDLMLTAGVTYYLRVAMDDGARPCNIQTSIGTPTYTWAGSINDDWFTAGNWSIGAVPTTGNSILIPVNATRACVVANGNAQAGEIIIEGGSLTVAQGAFLTVAGETYGVYVADGGTFEVAGEALLDAPDEAGLIVEEGAAHVLATGLITVSNAAVGVAVLDTLSIAGQLYSNNMEFDAVFVDENGGLDLTEGGMITVDGSNDNGFSVTGNCWVNGTLMISNVSGSGIDTDGGALTVSATGSVEINTANEGIANGNFTNNGNLSVSSTTNNAISTAADCANYGSIALSNGNQNGLNFTGTFTHEGTLTIENYARDAVLTSDAGTLSVGSTATININNVRRGLNGLLLINDGTIGIITTSSDAINTGGDCTNNGSISMANVDSDGIDLESGSTFTNTGTINIADASSQALEGSLFDQTATGELFIAGEVTSAVQLATGSALHPGSSPGCVDSETLSNLTGVELNIELEGTTPCTEYDQLQLGVQAVDITNGVLVLSGDYVPTAGETFVLIERSSTSSIVGNFVGLPEGATVDFNGVELEITYQGGDGDDVVLTAVAVLPLDLLSFSGEARDKTNLLNWTTANAVDFSHFEVERSPNGQGTWSVLAQSDLQSSGAHAYIDQTPLSTAYYRLKMIDLDGAFTYSRIIYLENNSHPTTGDIKVYPQPQLWAIYRGLDHRFTRRRNTKQALFGGHSRAGSLVHYGDGQSRSDDYLATRSHARHLLPDLPKSGWTTRYPASNDPMIIRIASLKVSVAPNKGPWSVLAQPDLQASGELDIFGLRPLPPPSPPLRLRPPLEREPKTTRYPASNDPMIIRIASLKVSVAPNKGPCSVLA
ncbi:MAG: fibronectin type III domain-containing protein [Bacteroidota bacterium]